MKILTLLLVFCILIQSIRANLLPFCIPQCVCYETTIRCLNLNLEKVPIVPAETTVLDLRFNKIRVLNPSAFRHLSRLTTLLLNNNQIEKLDDHLFGGLAELKYLYLYKNQIRFIGKNSFKNLHNLQHIYLNHNQLEEISNKGFADLPSLEKIYLQHNDLRHLSPDILHNNVNLQTIRLEGNPLVCDCRALWLKHLSENVSHFDATCDSPHELKGKTINKIVLNEFKCRAPQIIEEPKYEQFVNTSISLICRAIGDPEPSISWFHNDNQININYESKQFFISNDGSKLMIREISSATEGTYKCIAKNVAGIVSSKQIIVNFTKNYLKQNTINTIEVIKPIGVSLLLNCSKHTKRVNWSFNGSDFNHRESDRYQIMTNGSLLFRNLLPINRGFFKCSDAQHQTISSYKVIVLEPPVFSQVPDSIVEIESGKMLNLKCEATGFPNPHIEWKRKDKSNYTIEGKELLFKTISPNNEGIYECIARNDMGIAAKTVKIKVKGGDLQLNLEIPDDSDTSQLLAAVQEAKHRINKFDNGTARSVLNKTHKNSKNNIITVDQAINSTLRLIHNKNHRIQSPGKLLQIARFPLLPESIEFAKSIEIYEKALEIIRRKAEGKTKLPMAEFKYEDLLSPNQLNILAHLSGCLVGHRLHNTHITANCKDDCFHQSYRSYDGICNNIEKTLWGASLTPFQRLLPPIYEDGINLPVGWFPDRKYGGFPKPNARKVCQKILTTKNVTTDSKHSHMLMQFGQFLDHDIDFSMPSVSFNTFDRESLDCSKTCEKIHPCFSIEIPDRDQRRNTTRKRHTFRHNTDQNCIELIRSSASCGSGFTSVAIGTLMHREQVNQLTSFIDASNVYGSISSLANHLRDRVPRDVGLLRSIKLYNKQYLPFNDARLPNDCQQDPRRSDFGCFLAGDIRANEQLGLLTMHTLWLREHNRIAKKLSELNPLWNGERIYQESRKIVGSQMQVITYKHWLPHILSTQGMTKLGPYKGYDNKINPSVANVFAAAALRFGHTLINPFLLRLNETYQPTTNFSSRLNLHNTFFAPHRLVEEGGIDPLLRGLLFSPTKSPRSDQIMNNELTEHLFVLARDISLDLGSLNIQRGRDHGLPSYNSWREYCNLRKVQTFDELRHEIKNKKIRAKLEEVYGHPDNIDLWVGAATEDILPLSKVGPTFECLLIEQFKRLRDGDRFYFENPEVFTSQQLNEINKSSLARVICDNADNITIITADVFLQPKHQNWIECQKLPFIDLNKWHNSLIPDKSCKNKNEGDFDIPLELLNKLQNG